jgi:hypothetical protein
MLADTTQSRNATQGARADETQGADARRGRNAGCRRLGRRESWRRKAGEEGAMLAAEGWWTLGQKVRDKGS